MYGTNKKVDLGEKGSFDVRKGLLHKKLGIPQDEPIPATDLQGHHTGTLGHEIAFAKAARTWKQKVSP